jgi:hypothetical protein
LDAFSYLSVLISIILGLGITQILTGLGRLLQSRHRTRMYWPSVLWAGLLLQIDVQAWWSMFGLRHYNDWTFGGFFVVLLQPITLYLLAALVLPEFSTADGVDLETTYYGHARWFFGLALFLLVVSLSKDLILNHRLPGAPNLLSHGVFLLLWTTALVTVNRRAHEVVAVLSQIFGLIYTGMLFAHLT